MSDTNSLSDLWRANRSKDPGADLCSILDGARIIAQSLNPKVEVTFAGVKTANTDMKNIYLSPRDLGNEYPVPGNIVDVLLGLTVHESGHTLFSEERGLFIHKLTNRAHIYSQDDRKYFEKLMDIFEDIYIDHLMTAYPGYRDYLQRERDHALGEFNPESVTKPLEAKCTRRDMFNALIYFTLAGGKLPSKISDDNMHTLANLASQANKMCTKKTSKTAAILSAWNIIKVLPNILTDEERGLAAPAPSSDKSEDEPQPASEKAQEDAGKEQDEQEKLEKQEGLYEESTEEDEGNAEAESEEGEETEQEAEGGESGEGDTEEEHGEDKPRDTEDEEEAGKEEGDEDVEAESGEGGIGEDTEVGDEGEGEGEDEVGPETDLDLASRIDDLVNDETKLPEDLANNVSEAIIEKRDDLTQLLSVLAKDSPYTIIAYTPDEDAERAAEARSQTSSVEEHIRRILQDYRFRRTKDYRGLMSGRVSTRRLHRAAYGDQRVFQRREKPEEIDMAICLLMDLSGSVHRDRPLIEQITCAICDAFQKEKMEFIALGYSGGHVAGQVGEQVSIPRLYDREVGRVNLGLDKEWGSTPSYEGLAAAVAQLLRLTGRKQKVLFHFTDGGPNSSNSPIIPELLEDARAKGITDIHIYLTGSGLSESRIESSKYLYGEVLPIEDINQLPEVIEQVLRERLQV